MDDFYKCHLSRASSWQAGDPSSLRVTDKASEAGGEGAAPGPMPEDDRQG